MKSMLKRLDNLQQQHPSFALPIATFKRFGEHGGGRLVTTISYWSFFSIFPLMLAFVTVLNIVLKDEPKTRQDLVDGALGQVPVVGSQLSSAPLGGSMVTVAFGLLAAIWTGLAAAAALQTSLNIVWDVPMNERPSGPMQRLRSLAFLVVLALGLVVSTLASNIAAILGVGWALGVVGLMITFTANLAILLFAFRFLMVHAPTLREMLPGAILAAFGLVILQSIGNWVVQRYLKGASDTYGTFAVVIALLSWFYLISRVILLGHELNAVLAHGFTPRSLLPGSELTDGDRRAVEFDVRRVGRDDRIQITTAVTSDPAPGSTAPDPVPSAPGE